jgi:hypothetical protein
MTLPSTLSAALRAATAVLLLSIATASNAVSV